MGGQGVPVAWRGVAWRGGGGGGRHTGPESGVCADSEPEGGVRACGVNLRGGDGGVGGWERKRGKGETEGVGRRRKIPYIIYI